jgi:signal peptidase II
MSRRSIFIILLIAFNIAIDQLSKFWVRANVDPNSISEIFGQKFILTNVENPGAFLGMGSDLNPTLKVILLLILPIIVLGIVVYHIFKEKYMDRLSLVGFCCIIGGGFANIYDRLMYGQVTDFWRIDLGGIFKTGIFNLADMSVTTGMILLVSAAIIYRKKDKA